MKVLFIIACLLNINLVIGQETCPEEFTYNFGYCYKYVSTALNFNQADSHCNGLATGCSLVSIHSPSEEGFVHGLVQTDGYYWIGLNDINNEADFVWTDRTLAKWTNWDCGSPGWNAGKDCVHGNEGDSNRWKDEDCENFYHFVCKVAAS
ncbi:C-type lectin mannose-binding isoform-like [Saccoglossus kowalevskii]|uniref:C-type lectin mannose-binding isoform-like n=1 Tax=Saccoglossus kowalevskii TaxID=10224 RepID=A0ABM0MUL7_SACKO|nr:PREDICTED: C-type lectin mannose-binding isoform-like [Saccoglossus kowalevskii]